MRREIFRVILIVAAAAIVGVMLVLGIPIHRV